MCCVGRQVYEAFKRTKERSEEDDDDGGGITWWRVREVGVDW